MLVDRTFVALGSTKAQNMVILLEDTLPAAYVFREFLRVIDNLGLDLGKRAGG
jgi:hypothetical protein